MCGIAGVVGEGALEHSEAVRRMLAAQVHRGPDGVGVYVSPSGACVLGHRRLAILDLSHAADQPMRSQDGRFVLTYNGECYNFPELRDELRAQGEHVFSTGDTEVLLRVLAREGSACLPRLNGMFVFGLWDEAGRRLMLARDRFGQKPVYFTRVGRLLLFASEIRALLASGLVPRRTNLDTICSYLACGVVPGPGSIVDGVRLLDAASVLEWDLTGPEQCRCYWEPVVERRTRSAEEIREAFVHTVDRHLVSDVPIGLFLSGGIDSSAVAAAAVRARRDKKVVSLSVVFPDARDFSEQEHARRMARWAGTDHREIELSGADLLGLLPEALAAQDQPTMDAVNTFTVSRAARMAGLTVALSGLGGDELFGGYPAFRDVPRMMVLYRLLGPLRVPAARYLGKESADSKRAPKLGEFLRSPGDLLSAYLVRRRVLSHRQIGQLLPWISKDAEPDDLTEVTRRSLKTLAADRDPHEAIRLLELRHYMGQVLLRDSDVMGMAVSLEIRMPFLDTTFTDLVLALGAESCRPRGTPKASLVEALGDWLPRENVHRRKQGFTFPFTNWMCRELREPVESGLQALGDMSGVFDRCAIQALWKAFLDHPETVGWSRPWALFVLGRYLNEHKLCV